MSLSAFPIGHVADLMEDFMPNNSKSNFTFTPRPEAHAMNWADQLSPVRHAVRNLLLRIEGATQKQLKAGETAAASCFLVYGDRGTGKTTVLLSVKVSR
jgi:Cdc6-like AAA superfamily ATPase